MTDTPKRGPGRPKGPTGNAMTARRRLHLPDALAERWDAATPDVIRAALDKGLPR